MDLHIVITSVSVLWLWSGEDNENLYFRAQTSLNSARLTHFFFFLGGGVSTSTISISGWKLLFFCRRGACYLKLMNTLQPIRIAYSRWPRNNVKKDVLQSMHMQTAITVMKMKIIVLSGMKMVLRLLPDQILSSLWHLRESEIEGMRQKIDLVRR